MGALLPPPFSHPSNEFFHLRPIFPRQREKFPRIQQRCLGPEESFKSPPNVRAVPRIQPVSRRSASITLPSLVFSRKCIGTTVHATLPRRVTRKSSPAVSFISAAPSR